MKLYDQLVVLANNTGMSTAGLLRLMINIGLVIIPYVKRPGITVLIKDGDTQREIIIPLP